jgi:hypothetical protein
MMSPRVHRPVARSAVLTLAMLAACHADDEALATRKFASSSANGLADAAPAEPKATDANPVLPAAPVAPTAASQRTLAPLLAKQLDNRMTVMASRSGKGRDALIQFGVLGGTLAAAPGLAEMTAHVLAEGGDPGQDRPSLRQSIARLGGTLEVQPGPVSTWLDIRVPSDSWIPAVAALRAAVDDPPQSRGQIERLRERFVTDRCSAIERDPIEVMAQRLLLGDRSTVEHVNELLDRDPSEVAEFVANVYRPDQAILAVEAPEDPNRIVTLLGKSDRDGFAGWRPRAGLPGAVKMLDRQFPPGVHWSPGTDDGRCQVALVMMLPDMWQADAAPLLVLQDCLTLDGTGGRLEKLQQQRDLGGLRWRSEVTQTPDATALLLRTEATADEAVRLWQVLSLARSSLREVPPNPSELDLARRRAPLTGRLGALDAGARLRQQVQAQLRQRSYADLDAAFIALDKQGIEPKANGTAFLKLPTAMIVVGGRVPAGPEVQTFQLLPAQRPVAPSQPTANAPPDPDTSANAKPWLDRAIRALGGPAALLRLDGWDHEAKLTHAEAPFAVETVAWRNDGSLTRMRRLLDAAIETKLTGAEATERLLEGSSRTLVPADVVQLRREQQRHPLALLAAHARGELQFRPIGQRPFGDREVMVLEATGTSFDRLWLHLDVQSSLPRLVEAWEPTTDGTIHLQDVWSDYRTVDGLWVPFYRQTTINEGQNRLDVTYQKWQPARRAP